MECPFAVSLIAVGSFTLFTVGVVVLLTWCYVYYAAGSFTMWYCEAPVLLVGGFFFSLQCRVLALSQVYCIICTMYAAACSIRVVVNSALLYVATACWLRACWEKLSVVLSWSGSLSFSWLGGVLLGLGSWIIFMAFGVSAGHQRFCWGLCWNRHLNGGCWITLCK